MGKSISNEMNQLENQYNLILEEERTVVGKQLELLNFMMGSLKDVLLLKQGKLKIILPEEEQLKYQNKENEIKKLVNTIFRKGPNKNL